MTPKTQKTIQILGILLAIIGAVGFILKIFWPVISHSGLAPGADVASFAHTAAFIVDYLKHFHRLPPIDPAWYVGFELRYAPPLINFVLGAIYYITHNIELSTRILHPLGLSIVFLTMFYMMRKEGYSTIAAWLGGLIFVFMPVIYGTVESYTKLMALFFLPLAFYFTNKILVTEKLKYIPYLAITIVLSIYGHAMNGFVYAFILSIYAMIYAILDRRITTRRFFLVICGVALGFLLSSQYLAPFILERSAEINIPSAGEIKFSFLTNLKGLALLVGGPFLLIPLLAVWRQKQSRVVALGLTGVLTLSVSFGYSYGLGAYFPFNQVYYYIWLFPSALCFAYILGASIDIWQPKKLFSLLLKIGLGIAAFFLFFTVMNRLNLGVERLTNFQMYQSPSDRELSNALNQLTNPGRLFISHSPFGLTNWIIGQTTDKTNVEGHYYAITRMNKHLAHIADAIHNRYYNYPINKLKYYNVRYVVGNQYLKDIKDYQGIFVGREFSKKLTQEGFKLVFQSSQTSQKHYADYWLYYRDEPSTSLMPVDEKTLIIGKYKSTLAAAISPNITAIESGSDYLDDYSNDFLKHFDTVILYGFNYRNKSAAEKIARTYVQNGGNLVVELFNMSASPLAGNPNFLGVNSFPIQSLKESASIEILNKNNNVGRFIPNTFNIPGEVIDDGTGTFKYLPLKDWNALQYTGLDQSLARLTNEDGIFSIMGYKNIDGGNVTFVGLNFFYHLYLTHDPNELSMVTSLIGNQQLNFGPGAQPESVGAPRITQNEFSPGKLSFSIQSQNENLYLASMSYSPHWQAYLNGKKTKIYNLEDLMVVQIPAGSSNLEFRYESTAISLTGWILSIMTLVFLIMMPIIFRQKKKSNG